MAKAGGPDYRSADQIKQLKTAMVSAGLAAPLTTAESGIHFADYPQLQGTLLYKSDALNHVDIIEKANVEGIYLPDDLAAILGAHAGIPIARTSSPPIMVAGIYKSIARAPVSPFWCQDRQIFKLNPGSDKGPPYLVLATNLDLFSNPSDLIQLGPDYYLTSPVVIRSSALSDAHKWQAQLRTAIDSVDASKYPFNGISAGGDLNDTVRDVSLIRQGLIGPIAPITIGGSLLALFLVAAAGSYWSDRRYAEVRLLASRGVGACGLALKAALELFIPALIGSILGIFGAFFLVKALGPSSVYDDGALGQTIITPAIGLVLGMAVMSAVAGLRAREHMEKEVGRRRSITAKIPWELAIIAAAGVTWALLRANGAVSNQRNIPVLHVSVLVFPLLLIVGVSALFVRLLVFAIRSIRRFAAHRSNPVFLAVSRISASRVVSGVVLAAVATPIAMSLYAAALTDSSRSTLEAKGNVFVGSDVAFTTVGTIDPTSAAGKSGTVVSRYGYVKIDGVEAELLVVDPATFARYAYWISDFTGQDLQQTAKELAQRGRWPNSRPGHRNQQSKRPDTRG